MLRFLTFNLDHRVDNGYKLELRYSGQSMEEKPGAIHEDNGAVKECRTGLNQVAAPVTGWTTLRPIQSRTAENCDCFALCCCGDTLKGTVELSINTLKLCT